jgi:hypothetical protein
LVACDFFKSLAQTELRARREAFVVPFDAGNDDP